MTTRGIRILDTEDRVVSVNLKDILDEIERGESLHWSILFFDGMGQLKDGKSINDFVEEIDSAERGFFITWNDLNALAKCMQQIRDITIIGCKDLDDIRRHDQEQEMYENRDIVIEMCDTSFWEVFSKDENLIKNLKAKFKDTEPLETDFLTHNEGESKYRVACEWGKNSNLIKDIDFTDHGRPDKCLNPHQHMWVKSSTDGSLKRGVTEPLTGWNY